MGGSAAIDELVEKIIEMENYPEEIQQIISSDGRRTLVEYRAAWARTHLKWAGVIDNSSKGVWVLLEKGEKLTKAEAEKITKEVRIKKREKRKGKNESATDQDLQNLIDESPEEDDWKDVLLNKLKTIKSNAFERLSQLVLRESGFTKVQVTGRSGDGGIDGIGILRVNLLSFHVSFQCKRYQGSVSSGAIRDFRGAMIGRGDKGLFITTGTFTSEARKEANRDGAPAIDLIDGEDFCNLLKNLKLGLSTELIEKVDVHEEWFDAI